MVVAGFVLSTDIMSITGQHPVRDGMSVENGCTRRSLHPVRDVILVENEIFPTRLRRPVRDGMLVENSAPTARNASSGTKSRT